MSPIEDLNNRYKLMPETKAMSFQEQLQMAIKDGMKLLEKEKNLNNNNNKISVLKSDNKQKSKNPYLQAREKIISQMSKSDQMMIEKMENGKMEKNRWYDDFVKKIVKLGDEISDLT